MQIDILTLFPGIFDGPLDESILGRAREAGLVEINVHDLRPFGLGKHRVADDTPYGGGAGMVMRPEPIHEAMKSLLGEPDQPREAHVVFLTPQGRPLTHKRVEALSKMPRLVLLCGRYEGIDERIRKIWIDEEISIGDYVLTGGELPALVLIDAITRLLPGALGNADSAPNDSFAQGILDCPHYTRPETFEGLQVPPVLLSGHHAEIEAWRRRQALKRTLAVRPDLLEHAALDEKDRSEIKKISENPGAEDA
jgi:tRNA (guanine37-N1)-methyltransferase